MNKLIEGFSAGRTILVSGTCGTGKTTFAVQFLYNGIVTYNEPGIIVTMEQSPSELRSDMLKHGFDLGKLEKEGKLVIIDVSLSKFAVTDILPVAKKRDRSFSFTQMELSDISDVVNAITDAANAIKATRVVVDSLLALSSLSKTKENAWEVLFRMNYRLKLNGLTALLISEISEHSDLLLTNIEEYVTDGGYYSWRK